MRALGMAGPDDLPVVLPVIFILYPLIFICLFFEHVYYTYYNEHVYL